MKRHYSNPPIIEAVCEIHFERDLPFTPDEIEKLKPIWEPLFPEIKINEDKRVKFEIGINGPNTIEEKLGNRLVARSSDGVRLAQLSPHFLAVNQLKPYPGWSEGFRSDIKNRLLDISTNLGVKRVKHISLRYIDRLDFPQVPLDWNEWFSFSLPFPPSLPSKGGNVQFHFEQQIDDSVSSALHIVTVDSVQSDQTSVILDCSIFWTGSASLGECDELLEKVHQPHPHIFDEILSEQSRSLFGAHNE